MSKRLCGAEVSTGVEPQQARILFMLSPAKDGCQLQAVKMFLNITMNK